MFKDLCTIIYYTSNRENPEFEKKIQENILKQKGDIPIISVSQKPMDFGKNICVGDVGFSYLNGMRQMLIGTKAATTPFVISTESDVLYPKDYFTFIPKENECYRYDNIWIVFKDRKYGNYKRKKYKYSEGVQICDRKLLIEKYEKFLENSPEWFNGESVITKKGKEPFRGYSWKTFSGVPCISFKTGNGMRQSTPTQNNIPPVRNLPYWGDINDLRNKYL